MSADYWDDILEEPGYRYYRNRAWDDPGFAAYMDDPDLEDSQED